VSKAKKRDLVSLEHMTAAELSAILDLAIRQKRDPAVYRDKQVLQGKTMGLFFEKPSMRTRLSFEVAAFQLGGHCIYMGPETGKIGERESVKDYAEVASRYIDVFVLRTFKHQIVVDMARYADKPVINALSDDQHPCQALGDLLTIREKLGRLDKVKLVFAGDCNNVCRSLAHSAPKLGVEFVVTCPPGYEFGAEFFKKWNISLEPDPRKALAGADVVYTDVWASMGQESQAEQRRKAFRPYQINAAILAAAPKAIVMHDLPAHRGEEITDEVIDGPQSVVVDEAENRMHAQRAVLTLLLGS
jgi:ornithine carbamoyltransferase